MKICIFGAGAVGGHAAARLARGGAEVSVVARGANLAAIRARGLEVRAPEGTFHATVAASDDPASLGPQDAVLVTLKAPALPSLAASITPLLGPDTAVAFAMNGIPWWYFHAEGSKQEGRQLPRLDPGGALWSAIGPQRALGAVVNSACTVVEPGVIQVANPGSRITLGEPDGTISPRATALAAALRAGGVASEAVDDIRTRVWAKLALNIATGPMAILSSQPGAAYLAEPACAAALRALLTEVAALAGAYGCAIHLDPEATIAATRRLHHAPSILQDLQLGRPMEVDAQLTVPAELGQLAGVPCPTLDLLAALVRQRAAAARLYAA